MQIEQIPVLMKVFVFLFVPLVLATRSRILRGVLFHVFMMLLFIVIGSGLLFWGRHLLHGNNNFAGVIVLLISANFFMGVPVFIYLARRDGQDTIRENIKTILNLNRDEYIIARRSEIWWPIFFIPRDPGSHTAVFTGRKWVKNMHGFNFAELLITNKRVFVQSLFFAMPLLDMHIQDIKEVDFHDADQGLLKLEIAKSTVGAFVKLFHHVANIQGVICLNVGQRSEEWKTLIERTRENESIGKSNA